LQPSDDLAPAIDRVRLVLDANVVVQLSLAGGELGRLEGHQLVAPPVMASEFTSVLSEMTFRGEIPADAARQALAMLPTFGIRREQPDGLFERAWEVARHLGWAKSYDAEYVALALSMGSPLVTLDGRLRRGAGHLVQMPLLTELESAT
jgi:predicted nucleic acid-binding protein